MIWIRASFFLFCSLIASMPAIAEVTADGTTSTTVTSSDNKNFTIDGGNRPEGGNNLFHSFQDFSVPTGGSADFNNALDIKNIFSRVTGGNLSSIDGLIRTNNANLFLINPAGILFGAGASLNLGSGSFLGSTADSILFPEGEFSAVDLANPPLLTVNAPIGLGIRDNPAPIINRSLTRNMTDNDLVGLEVSSGANLTLVGGDIRFEGGKATVPGGRVYLGGLSTAGEIGINSDGSLSFPEGVERADVSLTNEAFVDVRAGGGGSIDIHARNLNLSKESELLAGIARNMGSPNAQAGDIFIGATERIFLDRGSEINNQVGRNAIGNSGDIEIETGSLLLRNGARLNASINGEGDSGQIRIKTRDSVILENSTDNEDEGARSEIRNRVERNRIGNAGGIKIETDALIVRNGARVNASTAGIGNSGLIEIIARDSVLLEKLNGREGISSIESRVQSRGIGDAAGVEITTGSLTVRDGAFISGTTLGRGDGGKVKIQADSILLEGISSANPNERTSVVSRVGRVSAVGEAAGVGNSGGVEITTGSLRIKDGARINTEIRGVGKAGNITINADTVEIGAGSELSSTTFSESSAGSINIQARDSTTIIGEDSGIFANTQPGSTGDGGTISIGDSSQFAGKLTISDGAQIAVDSQGDGNGGKISVWTRALSLDNQAKLSAETMAGSGGNIDLQVDESIKLKRESTISAQAKEDADGGNININAELIITSLNQNNDIIANANRGAGGNINITAEGVFNIQERPLNPITNDINASSEFGLDGTVSINTPDTSTLQETVETPEIVEPQVLSAKACSVRGESGVSSFNIAGKGGVPPVLTAPLTADAIHIEGKTVTLQPEVDEANVAKTEQTEPKKRKFVTLVEQTESISLEDIVPARGAIILENGDVLLTAYPTPNNVSRTPVKSANCLL